MEQDSTEEADMEQACTPDLSGLVCDDRASIVEKHRGLRMKELNVIREFLICNADEYQRLGWTDPTGEAIRPTSIDFQQVSNSYDTDLTAYWYSSMTG